MFINDLGPDYADDNLSGALFMYNGKVCRVNSIGSREVQALNLETMSNISFPASEFTGWKSFKYPRLGYRKFEDGIVGRVVRTPRSYTRGINFDNVRIDLTMRSAELMKHTVAEDRECDIDYLDYTDASYYWKEANWASIAVQIMNPTYDGKEKYVALMRRDMDAFVPNSNTMLEWNNNTLDIHVGGNHIGSLRAGTKIVSAPNNRNIIKSIVRKYAN